MKAKRRNFNSAVDSLNQSSPAPSAIAKEVGLKDRQRVHHFLSDGSWKAEQVQRTQIEGGYQSHQGDPVNPVVHS